MRECWLFMLLTSITALSMAQNSLHPEYYQSLQQVIEKLENEHDVRFSYADQTIMGTSVNIPIKSKTDLKTTIHEVQEVTHLKFEWVNDKYIIIRPYEKGDLINICGIVLDENQLPLPGALIRTEEIGSGAVTDGEGHFTIFSVPFEQKINIQFLGYQPKTVTAGNFLKLSDCQVIIMQEDIQILRVLTVRDYLNTGVTKTRKDIIIEPRILRILPGLTEPDLLKSLQQSPGVHSPYETASGLHVRGGTPDQNLVLWNGIKTYHQAHFFGMLSSFNPYIVEKVTFIKHGSSPKYGERVSSVMDIRTNEEVPEKISGGAGINMIYGDFYVNSPIIKDKLSLLLSGRRSYTDLFETFTYRQMSDRVFQNTKIGNSDLDNIDQSRNQFFFNDFANTIIYEPTPKNKFMVNTLYNENDLDFKSESTTNNRSYNDKLRTANEGYNVRWMNTKTKSSIETNIYYSRYLLQYEFISIKDDTTDISTKKNLITDYGVDLNTKFELTPHHHLLPGYQFSSKNIKWAFESTSPSYELVLDAANENIQSHSLYLDYQFHPKDHSLLTTGFRINHYNELGSTFFEPRISADRQFSSWLSFNASAEYRTQVASQIKESVVSDLSLENQVWTLSSKNQFPVIESYQFNLGSVVDIGGWYLDTEVYIKQISGITSLTFGFLNPVDNEFRQGSSDIFGTDFFLKKVVGDYKCWINYSYIRTENKFKGLNNNKPFPGNWNIEHSVRISQFYKLKHLEFALGWNWHTGKSFTDVVEDPNVEGPIGILYGSLNGRNLPVYHRLDFSVLYDFFSKKSDDLRFRAGFSILNLYNRRNILNREFRATPSLQNELIDTRVHSLGITPNVTLRIFW